MKKIQPQTDNVAGKGSSILVAFSDNGGYSLIKHLNSPGFCFKIYKIFLQEGPFSISYKYFFKSNVTENY